MNYEIAEFEERYSFLSKYLFALRCSQIMIHLCGEPLQPHNLSAGAKLDVTRNNILACKYILYDAEAVKAP